MRRLASYILLVLAPGAAVGAQSTPTVAPALTVGTVDSLWSPTLKESRRYLVYTPPSYDDTTYLPRRYPVLYLLDGDAHFHSVTGLLQILSTGVNGTFVLPEMIVVAIPNTNRLRDMTPTHVERDFTGQPSPALAASGGMGNFLGFIRNELAPRIEQRYRTAPYRVLVGHSLGGITAIQALYTMPDAFQAYLAIDPSLWWDDRLLLRQAREHVSRPGLAGRTLFVGQANTISPGDTTVNLHYNAIVQFNGVLENFNTSGLRYAYRYYPNDSHGSVPLMAEYDGLRFIFDSYDVSFVRATSEPNYIVDHFAGVSKALGYRVDPPEAMVDMLGKITMAGDTAAAQRLFELNARNYPASASAHAALGDLWLARRDTVQARTHYAKALSLKPGLRRAREMVDSLKK